MHNRTCQTKSSKKILYKAFIVKHKANIMYPKLIQSVDVLSGNALTFSLGTIICLHFSFLKILQKCNNSKLCFWLGTYFWIFPVNLMQ